MARLISNTQLFLDQKQVLGYRVQSSKQKAVSESRSSDCEVSPNFPLLDKRLLALENDVVKTKELNGVIERLSALEVGDDQTKTIKKLEALVDSQSLLLQKLEMEVNTLISKGRATRVQMDNFREVVGQQAESATWRVWAIAKADVVVYVSPAVSLNVLDHVKILKGESVTLCVPEDGSVAWVRCLRLVDTGDLVSGWVERSDENFGDYSLHAPALSA